MHVALPHLDLGWQLGAPVVLAFVLLALALRRRFPRCGSAAREAAIVFGLYSLWQLVGQFAIRRVDGARERGESLLRLERLLHLPAEHAVQAPVVAHPWLAQAANAYYMYGHFLPISAVLAWVWWRHRDRYPVLRARLIGYTGLALLVQTIPVAPPRLVPAAGLVDTGLQYGQSAYGPLAPGAANQLAAMPSDHVGWALLGGLTVVAVSRSRWRWLALAHPVLMTWVVVVTGNHYWLDAIVAGALLALVALVLAAAPRLRDRLRSAGSPREPAALGDLKPVPAGLAAPSPAGVSGRDRRPPPRRAAPQRRFRAAPAWTGAGRCR